MHSPFAHLNGVFIGHPFIEGHVIVLFKQLPSGHNLNSSGQEGFIGQFSSSEAQLPSGHFIGK